MERSKGPLASTETRLGAVAEGKRQTASGKGLKDEERHWAGAERRKAPLEGVTHLRGELSMREGLCEEEGL